MRCLYQDEIQYYGPVIDCAPSALADGIEQDRDQEPPAGVPRTSAQAAIEEISSPLTSETD